jgi:hypothetical protein
MIIICSTEEKVVTDYGTAIFKPTKKVKKNHCTKCWLYPAVCHLVPCGVIKRRKDGLVGVFTIQKMPL